MSENIIFLSNKGGAGKSTIISNIAHSLAGKYGKKVGILDLNFTSPMIAHYLGVAGSRMEIRNKSIVPVSVTNNLSVVSNEFFIEKKDYPVVMRYYMHELLVKQFIEDTDWGNPDYILIDTPSVFTTAIMEVLDREDYVSNAIAVTTCEAAAVISLKRTMSFMQQYSIELKGIVENMFEVKCSGCHNRTELFSDTGFEEYVSSENIDVIAKLPFDRALLESSNRGRPLFEERNNDNVRIFNHIAGSIVKEKETDE
ncbi:MAG: P-loop NTPase [bacterium]